MGGAVLSNCQMLVMLALQGHVVCGNTADAHEAVDSRG